MDNNRLTFKESKLLSAFGFNLFFASAASAVPEWSTKFWLINTTVAMFFIIRTVYAWLTMTDSKRYFSIGSYGMIFMMAFVCPQPIIRLPWIGESHLWILFVVTWLLLFIVTTYLNGKLAKCLKIRLIPRVEEFFIYYFLLLSSFFPSL